MSMGTRNTGSPGWRQAMLALIAGASCLMGAAQANEAGTGTDQEVLRSSTPVILPPRAQPRDEAFDQASDSLMPLSPEEIRRYKRMLEQKQDAMYGGAPPKTNSRLYQVSLETGADIPTVYIAPGYVASIVLIDAYGNPWPVSGAPAVGNPNLYSVDAVESEDRNVLNVSALTGAGSSNLAVSLKGQSVPMNIRLVTQRNKAVIRADMRLQDRGPKTDPVQASHNSIPAATPDDRMMAFVDGVPPSSARAVRTSDSGFRAWIDNDMLYLRTRHALLSPRWQSVSHGTAGLRVYRMSPTPMALYADKGETRTLRIDLNGSRPPADAR